jgi:hypothetical protein
MDENPRSVTSGSGATRWPTLALAATLAVCFVVTTHGQAGTTRPELLSGPWELASPSGVDGIFVMISQGVDRSDHQQTIRGQTTQVRVYHRKDGHETWGWHVVSPPDDATVEFDGRRLRVVGLTATFDQDAARWTGRWLVDGQTREVVLERPHPAKGVTLNALCGDWEGLPDATRESVPTRLHIVQSSDGMLGAWMDFLGVIQNQSYGKSFKVISADPMNVILQDDSSGTLTIYYRFSGVLSNDGNTITGNWDVPSGRPARQTFRRIS